MVRHQQRDGLGRKEQKKKRTISEKLHTDLCNGEPSKLLQNLIELNPKCNRFESG